jgi:hypothetical protein
MKPRIKKLAGIPIAVVHRTTPHKWELKPNPSRLPKIGTPVSTNEYFVSREVTRPFVEWKKGIKLPAPPSLPEYHDAITLRERFMELKTDQQFLDFLNLVGKFTSLTEAERSYGWSLKELMGCQEMFRELATRSPETWREYAQGLISPNSIVHRGIVSAVAVSSKHKIEFHWKDRPPVGWYGARNLAVIETTDAISAIVTTIELDHLRGAKFGTCARKDCPKFFEITSKHRRKYCTQECAHLASIRRMRALQKRGASKSRVHKAKTPRQT